MRKVELAALVQAPIAESEEVAAVTAVAQSLLAGLNDPDVLSAIDAADQPGQSSAHIQAAFLEHATKLGFRSERTGLFKDYDNSALRPDYYLSLPRTGIILEVERGKTTINNMDLLDFWKCHICPSANYLFLMVPTALRQNSSMTPRNEYAAVKRRLSSFFTPDTFTNVRGCFLFGY